MFKCPHCDVSLSEHSGYGRRAARLICHYCGYEEPVSHTCPVCGSRYVLAFRAGTQQIEREVARTWPEARVLRMDADTTGRKGSYEQILSSFAAHEADILIGTQMIVKGHDFPGVTLMGILAADMSLSAGDYRASERTFELLTQAAGRAGRGSDPGHVVIQTYQPEHYAICHAATQDYDSFYSEELSYRSLLFYPPLSHILVVQIYSTDEAGGMHLAALMRSRIEQEHMRDRLEGAGEAEPPIVIGPAPARISRIEDVYRYAVYVKHRDIEVLIALRAMLEEEFDAETDPVGGEAGFQFDLDPMRGF